MPRADLHPARRREKFTPGFYFELFLNLVSPRPYAIKKYESAAMWREIVERERKAHSICSFVIFSRPRRTFRATLTTPAVLFQHNVEAMIWKRHYEVQTNPVKKAYLYGQWQKMRRFEKEMCRRFDSCDRACRRTIASR